MTVDYAKVGLKVGLEIHQQLNAKTKLFCSCPPELFKEEPEITFLRRLRPTQSELGQVDPAAYFEFQKGVRILYEANKASSCLVEMDEEPPHPINLEAVEIVLTVSLDDERRSPWTRFTSCAKQSSTAPTPRVSSVPAPSPRTAGLRSAKKSSRSRRCSLRRMPPARRERMDEGKTIRYRIDRLGIPLIEIATGPVIYSPMEAQEVALVIGRILRDTGKVMRGLGTIRQDLNVSLPNGALIEIKGVQELELISTVIEYEVSRQLGLIEVKEELARRGVKAEALKPEFVDVTRRLQGDKKQSHPKSRRQKPESHGCQAAQLRWACSNGSLCPTSELEPNCLTAPSSGAESAASSTATKCQTTASPPKRWKRSESRLRRRGGRLCFRG